MWTFIHIIDWLLWIFIAPYVMYVSFYALVSLFPSRTSKHKYQTSDIKHQTSTFLILFPAYKEDCVIIHSVQQFLESSYPKELYHIGVISDHMQEETNERLRKLPISILTPQFKKSSKAKALQYAIENTDKLYDYVIIMDADNVVLPEFLEQVNASCQQGYQAIQCHRCAKNCDNDVAVLDGISEEINNTIFRKAHNSIGLSSALIGSGMCFDYKWFKENVYNLTTAGEDRELEGLLLRQGKYIHYEADIHVFDEKVSNKENFQKQRLRWMTAQIQSLFNMLPYIPKAIITGNIDYLDKTIQQTLIPRSMLIVFTFMFAFLVTLLSWQWGIKWWLLFLFICLSLYVSTPKKLRSHSVFGKIVSLPELVWKMVLNILKIDHKNTDFIHTTHNK